MKKLAAAICVAILLILLSFSASAFPSKIHDNHLETALFGPNGLQTTNKRAKDMFEALKLASYLCIDQFNNAGKEHLDKLLDIQKEYWIEFFPTWTIYPKTIADIDYPGNYTHRKYTHLGWEYEYKEDEHVPDWPRRWCKRQKLLNSTIEAVFHIDNWPFSINSSTGENICKLLYYIHIVGDHIAFEDFSTYARTAKFICPLGGFGNTTVIPELTKVLNELFGVDACELIQRLNVIEMDLRAICNTDGTVTEANFRQYQDCAEKVLEALNESLPILLKKQPYFSKVFY